MRAFVSIAGVTAIMCLLSTVVVPGANGQGTCIGNYTDDFEDGILPAGWTPTTGCVAAVETGGQLKTARSLGCPDYQSRLWMDPAQVTVCGDFDVSVDFDLVDFPVPSGGGVVASLDVYSVGSGHIATIERYNRVLGACNPSTQNYKAWTYVSSNCDAAVQWAPTTDVAGRLRITREGSTIRLYYWSGSGWIQLKSDTVPLDEVYFRLRSDSPSGVDVALDVRWDNLIVVSEPATPCICMGDFTDDFEDGVLPTEGWSYSTGCRPVSETGGKLRTYRQAGCTGGAYYQMDRNQQVICGDFDVSVDFQLVNLPVTSTPAYAQLSVYSLSGTPFATIQRYNLSPAGCNPSTQTYKAWTTIPNNCNSSVKWASASGSTGKFRITRTGTTVRLYYWNGSGWTQLKSDNLTAEDVFVRVWVDANGGAATSFAMDVRWDNLTILSEACQTVAVAGVVTSDCDGPVSGTTVALTDGNGDTFDATTDGSGAYVFPAVAYSVQPGDVTITVPDGYTVTGPTSVPVGLTSDQTVNFALDCVYVSVSGTVAGCEGGLQGVTVDLDLDPLNPGAAMSTTATDAGGAYSFPGLRWSSMDAEVSVVVPLGYEPVSPVDGQVMVPIQTDQTVDFTLDCLEPTDGARGTGYWKHQAKVYVKGTGNAQESQEDMETTYPQAVYNHFFENALNSIAVDGVTYADYGSGPEPMDLETIHTTLSAKGNEGATARAKQHYLALLLNVASGRLLTSSVISEDGATVSQALQQVAANLNDGDPSNDETAKDISETINNAQTVAAGLIDLDLDQIAYRRGTPGATRLIGALPNPFHGSAQVRYRLAEPAPVRLAVYDVRGRLVRTLVEQEEPAGEHTVTWDGRNDRGTRAVSGIYYVRLKAGPTQAVRSLIRLQ